MAIQGGRLLTVNFTLTLMKCLKEEYVVHKE